MAVSLQQFVDRLVQSGLMSADEVKAFQQGLPSEKRPKDGEAFAEALVQAGKLTKYQVQAVCQGKLKGLVFGEYVVQDKLGQGGMGVVLKAQHRRMKRLVAVKVLPPSAMKSPDAVQRFYREVEAVARLSHANIVTAYDAGEHAGIHYLVMEYVEGSDLGALVKQRGPLPPPQAIDCVLQAARGLEYAHRHGIVHRDIKPANLLVDKQGTVKVLDLGLARFTEMVGDDPAARALTGTGQIMGTIEYMSPEQAMDTREADHRSDIYSLGCTLYRLATGRPVYQGDTTMKTILAHRDQPIPRMRDVRPEVPEALDAVFRRMVAKQPEDRYQSMSEVVAALDACLAAWKQTAAVVGSEPAEDSSINGWLAQISAPSPAPRAVQRGEATMVHRVEDETHGALGRKPSAVAANKRLWMAAGAIGGTVILLLLAFVLGRGEKTPATGAAGSSEQIAKKPAASSSVATTAPESNEKKAGNLADSPLPSAGTAPAPTAPAEPPKGPEWETAWNEAQTQARSLLAEKKYSESRAVVKAVIERHAVAKVAEDGAKLLAEIEAAEKQPPAQADKTAETKPADAPPPPSAPVVWPEEEKQGKTEARFAAALAPVEKLAAAWDFRGAAVAMREIRFEEKELQDRLIQRRDDLKRMHELKERIIAKINQAEPPLKKTALGIKGIGGDVVKADEQGITAKLTSGKSETYAWSDLGPKALSKLVPQTIDREAADDWLAAALVAYACDDVVQAEKWFDQAQTLGAATDTYLTPLAVKAFLRAKGLFEEKDYAAAETALTRIEEQYAKLPWYAANQKTIAAARSAAQSGARESEAEKLYAEAAELFAKKEFYDAKPLVQQLKKDYPATKPVTEAQRKPSFAELDQATAKLGKRLTVRLDGKGQFRRIGDAVAQANIGDLIEIQDNGPYSEGVLIPAEKSGLTLRGKKGVWPLLISMEPYSVAGPLIDVRAPNTTLQRMVLINRAPKPGPKGRGPHCILNDVPHLRVEAVIADMEGSAVFNGCDGGIHVENCLIFGTFTPAYGGALQRGRVQSSLVRDLRLDGSIEVVQSSTIQKVTVTRVGTPGTPFKDCIIGDFQYDGGVPGLCMDHCLTFGSVSADVERGKGCLQGNPMFRDPSNLDYRLMPGSPAIGKASDGGDLGCRFTPEMMELCQVALELRKRGLIKF